MTKLVTVAAADPFGSDPRADVTVRICENVPHSLDGEPIAEWAERYRGFYQKQAQLVWQALRDSLPGGTLDALLRLHLEARASMLRVPQFDKE